MGHCDQKVRLMNIVTSMIIDTFEIKDHYNSSDTITLIKEEDD